MRLWIVAAIVMLIASAAVHADDTRPLTIIVAEQADDSYQVTWKIPANVDGGHLPNVAAPAGCRTNSARRRWTDTFGSWAGELWSCSRDIGGATIEIVYPFANPNLATIARLKLSDRPEKTIYLPPQDTQLVIPTETAPGNIFLDFLILGFEHIWKGIDHLLFIGGLIFIARSHRAIISTITGFTIAHSLTLALSALDVVRVPVTAVETAIALSIVFLAVEIVKGPRNTLTWRRPVFVSGSFGLLHGFGFAAVLREVGLPQTGLVAGLFAFNIGIELGQIVFALALVLLISLLRHIPAGLMRGDRIQLLSGYTIGVTAGFWLISRGIG